MATALASGQLTDFKLNSCVDKKAISHTTALIFMTCALSPCKLS